MSTKLVPRTELLEWLRKKESQLTRWQEITLEALKSGRVLALGAWEKVSQEFHDEFRSLGGSESGQAKADGGRRSQADGGTGAVTSEALPGLDVRPVGDASAGSVRPMGVPLLADNEPLADYKPEGDQQTNASPDVADDGANAARPDGRKILGAYRLRTYAGFVVFAAIEVPGSRGPVIICAPGLGLPGDGDLERCLEFGTPISWSSILEQLHVAE